MATLLIILTLPIIFAILAAIIVLRVALGIARRAHGQDRRRRRVRRVAVVLLANGTGEQGPKALAEPTSVSFKASTAS